MGQHPVGSQDEVHDPGHFIHQRVEAGVIVAVAHRKVAVEAVVAFAQGAPIPLVHLQGRKEMERVFMMALGPLPATADQAALVAEPKFGCRAEAWITFGVGGRGAGGRSPG